MFVLAPSALSTNTSADAGESASSSAAPAKEKGQLTRSGSGHAFMPPECKRGSEAKWRQHKLTEAEETDPALARRAVTAWNRMQ